MRLPLLPSLLLILASAAPLAAEDAVKQKGSTIVYRGEIVRYDDRGLTLKWGPRQELKEFAPEQIERVDTKWPPGFEPGKAALDKGAFAEAAAQLRAAVREEKRPWAQDLIKGHLLRALDGSGDVDAAAELFVELAPNRSDAAFVAFAPFRWTKEPPLSEQRVTAARAWLRHNEEPMVRLLAADWLIDADRAKAQAELERLLTDPDSRIRPIARAILLREQLLKDPKAVKKEDLAEYRAEVERLPNPVRVGPQYVLGLAYEAVGDPVDAALAFLYVPFVTLGPPDVQADALARAAQACRRAKLTGDAAKIEAELKKKFPAGAAAKRVTPAGKSASNSP